MPQQRPRAAIASFGIIAAVVVAGAAAFAYTAGWLSPDHITPLKVVRAVTPPGVAPLGHRRNHAKGICFTGIFEANGQGAALSRARVLTAGRYPALGRLNLGTGDPNAADATARIRGMGLQIAAPDGAVWRTGMINAPVFPVSTPQAFYALLLASASKAPDAIPKFAAAHPEIAAFAAWAKAAPWTSSYAEDRFYGLNAFLFIDAAGAAHAVRWALIPAAHPVPISPEELAKRGPNYLEQEIGERVRGAAQRWTMAVTLANPGDPTNDPSKVWPDDRRTIDVGTLIVQRIEAEADGPCRDINYDPTILPDGIRLSDDPFPAARAAVYAKSYDLRTAESRYYPRTGTGTTP